MIVDSHSPVKLATHFRKMDKIAAFSKTTVLDVKKHVWIEITFFTIIGVCVSIIKFETFPDYFGKRKHDRSAPMNYSASISSATYPGRKSTTTEENGWFRVIRKWRTRKRGRSKSEFNFGLIKNIKLS